MAILSVLVWHYGVVQVTAEPHSMVANVQRMLALTWSGVDLFFVLSGFLIGGILLDNRGASNYFKTFYVRRTCRIFPLYFLWILLFFGLTRVAPALFAARPLDWLFARPMPSWSYLSFTQNIAMAQVGTFGPNWLGITWSLAIEEQFYLVLPLLIYVVPPRRLRIVLIALILSASALRTIYFFTHPMAGFPAYVLMPCRADALLLGVLSAGMVRQERVRHFLKANVGLIYGLGGLLMAGVAAMLFAGVNIGSFAMSTYGYSLLAGLYTCVLLIAITETRGLVSAFARIKILQRLGMIAYGVYMFHQGISGLLHGLILKQSPQIHGVVSAAVTVGALICTLSLAQLSWLFFERRFVSMGHSLMYSDVQSTKRRVATPGTGEYQDAGRSFIGSVTQLFR